MRYGEYGFERMVYALPRCLNLVEELARTAGYGDEMITRLFEGGLRKVPVDGERPLVELVKDVLERLLLTFPELSQEVFGVVYAHSIPLVAPVATPFLNLCLKPFGLDQVPSVAISGQPCAILHLGVQIAGGWLRDAPLGKGILLLGADKAYSSKERIFFGSAMGDVAFAGYLTRESPSHRVLASISECEIIASEGEFSSKESIAQFRNLNPLFIRHAIETCLTIGNITLNDLRFIVPHTPYTLIWDVVANILSFPREKILTDYIADTGHLNSMDSFVHYMHAVEDGRINKGDISLLINPAFGGTRGCTLIQT